METMEGFRKMKHKFPQQCPKCKKIISEIYFCGITRIVNDYNCQCEDLEK